jgi:formylglycine-generating enzyme required for sulfatase activity
MRFAMLKRLFISILLLLFIPAIVLASRGINVVSIKDKSGKEVGLYKESHALVIGVSDYTAGWPDLPGVKKDVRLVKAALEKAGFNVVVSEDPDRAGLLKVFDDFINQYGNNPDARLLFYFAGHGHTMKLSYGGDMGYIIPTDAPNPNKDKGGFLAKALGMKSIEVYAEQIQAKHAMFLFDSCFSGSIFALSRAIPENINYKTSKPVRQFINAGAANETVPDESIFRHQFIEALEGEGDTDKDGYVTGIELGEFLQSKVVNYSRGSQHPQYGKIRNPYLDKGDFVFPLNTASLTPQSSDALAEERNKLEAERQRFESERKRFEEEKHLAEERKKLEEERHKFNVEQERQRQEDKRLADERQKEEAKLKAEQNKREEQLRMAKLTPREMPSTNSSGKCPSKMSFIPGGVFLAGNVYSLKEMSINALCMDQYEVTQADYKRVMGSNPSKFKGGNRPVEQVTWHEAKAYCEKVGKRLPTKWEWEKAAKAGTTTKYYCGNEPDTTYAWYGEDWDRGHHPVGQKKPNAFGLYDMSGNVWEWTDSVSSWDASTKVVGGGSWVHNVADMESTPHERSKPSKRLNFYGFRCAK